MWRESAWTSILQPRWSDAASAHGPRTRGERGRQGRGRGRGRGGASTRRRSRTSVGTRAVPKRRVYWSMSSGTPRMLSGSSMPARRSWMKPSEETTSDAARGSCCPRSGVGSFLPHTEDARSVVYLNLARNSNSEAIERVGRRALSGKWKKHGNTTHSSTKNGLRASTTGSECERYDSYLHSGVRICSQGGWQRKRWDQKLTRTPQYSCIDHAT